MPAITLQSKRYNLTRNVQHFSHSLDDLFRRFCERMARWDPVFKSESRETRFFLLQLCYSSHNASACLPDPITSSDMKDRYDDLCRWGILRAKGILFPLLSHTLTHMILLRERAKVKSIPEELKEALKIKNWRFNFMLNQIMVLSIVIACNRLQLHKSKLKISKNRRIRKMVH